MGRQGVEVYPMCNRFVQDGVEIKPGQKAKVLMRGPTGKFEMEFKAAVFGGPARRESRNYWLNRENAEEVLVPVEAFGEKDKVTGQQNWEQRFGRMEGLLLQQPPGKDYRLLKVVTQDAMEEQAARLGNDRVPVFNAE